MMPNRRSSAPPVEETESIAETMEKLPAYTQFLNQHLENLKVRYLYHRRADGTWLVTVTMLNTRQSSPDSPRSGSGCFFQVGFDVHDPAGCVTIARR